MPITHRVHNFAETFPPVLATQDGLRSPRGVDLDPNLVSQYAGANNILQKILPPGVFAAAVPGSTKYRALPRTKLRAANATNSPTLQVTKHTAQFFVSGDTLTAAVPYAAITLSGTYIAGETITITIGGRSFVYTVPTPVPPNLDALAADVAAKIAKSAINDVVEAIAGAGGVVMLLSTRNEWTQFTVIETSAGGGALPASGNLAMGGAIGTVQSVNYNPDTDTHTLTLTANATTAFPVGMPIGDLRYSPANLGIMTPNTYVDLLWGDNTMVACFTAASVYGVRLPYWDGQLSILFREITLV